MQNPFRQSGIIALLLVFVILSLSLTLSLPAAFVFINRAQSARVLADSDTALYAAEAGLEDGIYRAKNLLAYSPNYTLAVGSAHADINITANGSERLIESDGVAGKSTRKMYARITVNILVPKFFYGAQVGEGGIIMDQNSRVEAVGGAQGNVYSMGPVAGANKATITGDLIVSQAAQEDTSGEYAHTTCASDQLFGQANPTIDMAQSFIPSQTKPYPKISLRVKKVGTPGDRTVNITANVSGSPDHPNTTALASGTFSSALVGSSYAWIDVTFASPPNLTAGTTYWIVFDSGKNANDYWKWCKDAGAGYADGSPMYSKDWSDSRESWTGVAGDLAFKLYYGVTAVSVKDIDAQGSIHANTINTSNICGNAYYQTIDSSSTTFLNSPSSPTCPAPLTNGTGYDGQSDPPIQNMPISDANIASFEADAATGGDPIDGNCGDAGVPECVIPDSGGTLSIGPKIINGNLILSKKQTLIVTGTLYVKGYIDLNSPSGATVKCDSSFGAKSCMIITDKYVHIANNAIFGGSGSSGSFIMLLSNLQGCNGGSPQLATCSDNNSAISVRNNATTVILYTNYSTIDLNNNVFVTDVTAYRIHLANGAIVQYDTGLQSAFFQAGPGGAFDVLEWKEIQ